MKVLIIGGHLSPALSIIENLVNHEVFYVGRKHALEGDKALSLEYQTVTKLNIPFFEINTGRLQRSFTKHTLTSLTKIPIGFFQAFRILKKVNPDVVLGFGGYVSVPVVAASYFLRIPIVLHEQTLEVGFSNRILAKFAKRICISFEESRKFFPKNKTILTGIPLKKEILEAKKEVQNNLVPFLYITGGSLGSHTINELVLKALPVLLDNFEILHQTGDSKNFNDFERLTLFKQTLSKEKRDRYKIKKFLSTKETVETMQRASIVVSRSGINTVSELIYLEKAAFLIPISFSQRKEQLKNAIFIKELGLAEIGNEKILEEKEFNRILLTMQKNIKNYKLNTTENIIDKDAPLKIIKILENVSKKKKT